MPRSAAACASPPPAVWPQAARRLRERSWPLEAHNQEFEENIGKPVQEYLDSLTGPEPDRICPAGSTLVNGSLVPKP